MDHTTIRLTSDVSAQLFVADGTDYDPQTLAMLQAFYSRSTQSIGDRTRDLNSEQVKKSLQRYFVNYGHRSIGQCANFTIFLEDVSIFAAKAIQHHPLYNGQETSTRYYDFSERPAIFPQPFDAYTDGIRRLYVSVLSAAKEAYLAIAEKNGEKIDDTMERACAAKAFDLARAFLTAGFTTKLSWTTNFDQVQEQLMWMANSPVLELRMLALTVADMLNTRYPQATVDVLSLTNDWSSDCSSFGFFDNTDSIMDGLKQGFVTCRDDALAVYANFSHMENLAANFGAIELLSRRKRGQAVPRSFSRFGTFTFGFKIDYGSFRDLHRHRNGIVYFPSYPNNLELHPWYIEEMARLGILGKPGLSLCSTIGESISTLMNTLEFVRANLADMYGPNTQEYKAALMYYVPMGTMVDMVTRYDLPQAIYVAELRSARTVHPTARIAATNMAKAIRCHLPGAVALHIDSFEGISRKRGEQTILERNA